VARRERRQSRIVAPSALPITQTQRAHLSIEPPISIRADILPPIVFQLVIASPVALISPAQKRREELLKRLEEVAQKGEQFFL
jgi:hypothetical protein